ncbi:MAG: M23 family metallopeptidase [Chloroflexia bacterium]|nr:M23 family metallopeptidase [Chloroflexia bacterium]
MGSCCDGPHRRAFQPINGGLYLAQRFAIDFNRLDAEDRLVAGDPSLNESYPSFGQPVIAVAAGTVVAAVDQFPDQVPNAPTGVTLESANGNHVIIDLGDGRYAFYAHLRAGSVTVRAGDVVRRGDGLGALGNSGSSTGPHLHFHVMSAPSALVADGMPYVFDEFDLVGETPPIPELIALSENGTPVPLDTVETGPRLDALPLGRTVVDFPDHPAEE